MSKKKLGIGLGLIIIVLAAVFLYLTQSVKGETKSNRMIEGVSISGIDVSGMTKEEATQALEDYVAKEEKEEVTFTIDDLSCKVAVRKLGVTWNIKKSVDEAYQLGRGGNIFSNYSAVKKDQHTLYVTKEYKKETFLKAVKKASQKIITAPVNASLKRKNGKFVIVKEKKGYELKEDKTFSEFKKAMNKEKLESKLIAAATDAKYTTKDMEKVKDELGTYRTYYGSSASGRAANVANGARLINGTVVYPGETFSVYNTVSPFDAKHGYYLAGSYENGQTVQTYGGGICQVSTTLYNAVIRAELSIVERYPHSMTVSYVPRSADAAIAGTSKDLKFKNNTGAPIYIEGKTDGAYIRFTVYGKESDPDREVSFESETTSVKEAGEKEVKDPTLEEGKKVVESSGHTGYTARLWKIVKVNGKQVERKLFNTSSYISTPTTVRVGTKKKEEKTEKDKKTTTEKKNDKTTTEATTEKKKTTQKED